MSSDPESQESLNVSRSPNDLKTGPVSVFISYSHADSALVEELVRLLKPLARKGQVIAWTDKEISTGENWQEAISDALNRASVGVLIVSGDFLASDFIMEQELPILLTARSTYGLPLIWVPASDCLADEHPEITQLQAAFNPAKPLDRTARGNRKSMLAKVARAIRDAAAKVTEASDRPTLETAKSRDQFPDARSDWEDDDWDDDVQHGYWDHLEEFDPDEEAHLEPTHLEGLIVHLLRICEARYGDRPADRTFSSNASVINPPDFGHPEVDPFFLIEFDVAGRNGTDTVLVGGFDQTPDLPQLELFVNEGATPHRMKAADPYQQIDVVYDAGPPGRDVAPDEETLEFARANRLQLISLLEYSGLIDFTRYRTALEAELKQQRGAYPPALYIDQKFDVDLPGHPRKAPSDRSALQQLMEWVDDRHGRAVLVLGTFGTGKSFLMRKLALQMLETRPYVTPILIEIGKLEKQAEWQQLVAAHLAGTRYKQPFDPEKFELLLEDGRVVLIFDGFDELVLRVTYERALHHFEDLLTAARGNATIIITCRTEHFVSDQLVKQALFSRIENYGRHQFLTLRKFDLGQIEEFVRRRVRLDFECEQQDTGTAFSSADIDAEVANRVSYLTDIKDLMGLSATPRMLSFIAELSREELESARDPDNGEITSASLYRTLIFRWLKFEAEERQQNQPGDLQTPSQRTRFQAARILALNMWRRNLRSVGVHDLEEAIAEPLDELIRLYEHPVKEGAHLLGSGTLVWRSGDGRFEFLHQSVLEWLVADAAAENMRDGLPSEAANSLLSQREMSALMADFLIALAEPDRCDTWTREVLGSVRQVPQGLMENALLVQNRLGATQQRQTLDFSGQQLDGHDFSDRDLTGSNFSEASLRDAVFQDSVLRDCRFTNADLTGARFRSAMCQSTNFTGANLTRARFLGGSLDQAMCEDATVTLLGILRTDGDVAFRSDENSARFVTRDLPSGMLRRPLSSVIQTEPPAAPIRSVAWHPELPFVACASGSTVILMDVSTGKVLRTFAGHSGTVRSCNFSPDGARIVSGSADGTLKLWDTATGECLRAFTGHSAEVSSSGMSPDGMRVVSGSQDNTLKLWDSATGECLRTYAGHSDNVWSCEFAPDGATILSASSDESLKLWQTATGECERTFTGHSNYVWSCGFAPGGAQFVSGSADRTLKLWDVATGECLHTFAGHSNGIRSCNFTPDGASIISGSSDGTLRLWDAATGECVRTFSGHSNWVWACGFSPDGRQIVSGSSDRTMMLWNAKTTECLRTFEGHANRLWSCDVSSDGTAVVSGSDDKTLKLWDAAAGKSLRTLEGHAAPVRACSFSLDGLRIVSGSSDDTLKLWDATTGECLHTLKGHSNDVDACGFSPNGTQIVSGSYDKTLKLWDAATGKCLCTFTGHSDLVRSCGFSPDGARIVSGSSDNTLKLWRAATGKCVGTFDGHSTGVLSCAFSPDGGWIVSGSSDNTLKLWDVATGQCLRTFSGHRGAVSSCRFSPDGSMIVSGSRDRTLKLWDAATGECLRTFAGHSASVRSCGFSPDGARIVSGSSDNTLRLWDAATGEQLACFLSGADGWASLRHDGRYKYGGSVRGLFWHAIGFLRFEPGELDRWYPELQPLADNEAFLPA